MKDVHASSAVRVTLLETGEPLEAQLAGGQLRITIPDSLSAGLPEREAYVFKIAGAQ